MEWHRLGEKCKCGTTTAPARFYWDDDRKAITQAQAEAAYVEWALKNDILIRGLQHTPATQQHIATHPVVSEVATHPVDATHCNTCGKEFAGRGRECSTCRSRRSRQKA